MDSAQVTSNIIFCLRDTARGLLDLIYPPKCVACDSIQSHYLCPSCVNSIAYLEPPICSRCGLPTDGAHRCMPKCGPFAFAEARGVGVYDGALRKAIHELKYNSLAVVSGDLIELMTKYLSLHTAFAPGATCVIPIPIHKSREKLRGFNQSTLLARGIADYLHLPLVDNALYRKIPTPPQVDLPFHERVQNVRGAFAVRIEEAIAGQTILLIDDVMTTGATASEAARELRNNGAEKVYVLTLARSC